MIDGSAGVAHIFHALATSNRDDGSKKGPLVMARRKLKAKRRGRSGGQQLPELLTLLASQTRREILVELARKPQDRRTLAEALDVSVPAVTHHLRRLLAHDLVAAERLGRRNVYRMGRRATLILGRQKAILNVSTPEGSEATLSFQPAGRS